MVLGNSKLAFLATEATIYLSQSRLYFLDVRLTIKFLAHDPIYTINMKDRTQVPITVIIRTKQKAYTTSIAWMEIVLWKTTSQTSSF